MVPENLTSLERSEHNLFTQPADPSGPPPKRGHNTIKVNPVSNHIMGNHVFCNLQGIEGSAFADLVAAGPEVDAVFAVEIFPDAAYGHVGLVGSVQGHGVNHIFNIIHQHSALEVLNRFLDFIGGDMIFGLNVDGFRMAPDNRYADSGRRNGDGVVVENLMGFVHHLHFFLGIFVVQEHINLGDYVVGDLVMLGQAGGWKNLRFVGFPFGNGRRFVQEFVNAVFAGTGNGLVGAYDNPLD